MLRIAKAKGRKGADLLEFTLCLLPLLMLIFLMLDASWAIFVKSTLAFAVRAGVREGITITGTQARAMNSGAGLDLTTIVKNTVQANALGFLAGAPGWAKIKVNYIQPPGAGSNAASVDVSNQLTGNKALNIMQVSIQGFSLGPLAAIILGWNKPVNNNSMNISAVAADMIEPSSDPPIKGTAP